MTLIFGAELDLDVQCDRNSQRFGVELGSDEPGISSGRHGKRCVGGCQGKSEVCLFWLTGNGCYRKGGWYFGHPIPIVSMYFPLELFGQSHSSAPGCVRLPGGNRRR